MPLCFNTMPCIIPYHSSIRSLIHFSFVDRATQGAPLATQVCDRWHLLKNLGEAVEAFLIRAHIRLPEMAVQEPTQERPLTTYSATPAQQGRTQARLLRKWKLYERIHELHAGGMSLRTIGEELGLARNTVRKYFRQAPEPPLPTPRPLRASQLDRYEDYILMRLSQGCKNAAQIYREITEMGFKGGHTNVRAYVAHLRKSTANGLGLHQFREKSGPMPFLHEPYAGC
jgi:transposase